MAEGWINDVLEDSWEARSAGTEPAEAVHPIAVEVMAEVGVDLSGQRPESVETYLDDHWDLVITVCDSAQERCPIFPNPVEAVHISFPDPADAEGTRDERIAVFRAVRDAIKEQLLPQVAKRSV